MKWIEANSSRLCIAKSGGVGFRQKCRTLLWQTPTWETNHSWWWSSSSSFLSCKSTFVAFYLLFLQSFSDWQCVPAYIWPYCKYAHCTICMHCRSPKVGNVEFSIVASPVSTFVWPNTCSGLRWNTYIYIYMKAHFNVIQNKLAKLGDAIATSNLKLWITHSLTHSLTRYC